jgi:hypothetical protein
MSGQGRAHGKRALTVVLAMETTIAWPSMAIRSHCASRSKIDREWHEALSRAITALAGSIDVV